MQSCFIEPEKRYKSINYRFSFASRGMILRVINDMLIDLLAPMAKLDNDKRRERIKQGLANSGYKPTGKKANIAKHNRIRELASQTNMTKEEIAKAVGAGVATVYRALKQG